MFATTHWSLIVAARGESPAAQEALAELCRQYWYPLYAYIRRRGHNHDEAQDLTQEFFTRLLERKDLSEVDPSRGRFRSFLLAACRHLLSNERDRVEALKRGGGRQLLSLDFGDADRRYTAEPCHEHTPERLFERQWALTLLDSVLQRLRQHYQANGQLPLFEALKGFLTNTAEETHAAAAEALSMTPGVVKVAIHRLRHRYRELLHHEIAQTVEDTSAVEDEIRALFSAMRAP